MKKDNQLIYYVFLITIASTSLYIVFKNLPPIVGSFRFFWGPVTLIIILLSDPETYLKKPIVQVLVFGIVVLGVLQYTLWQYMTDWTRQGLLEDFYNLTIITTIFTYLYTNRKFYLWGKLGKFSFYFILITLIGTNIGLSMDPLIVRNSAASAFTPYQEQVFRLTGAAGYGYAQAFVFLIPILVYYIKYRKPFLFKRNVLILILVLIFITLFRAQVFGNILAALAIFFLSISGAERAQKSILPIALLSIIFIAIPNSVYADFFLFLSGYFDSSSIVFSKLTDFATFVQTSEFNTTTQAGGRAERYPMLFEAFIVNPFFGTASVATSYDIGAGGHLFWMNRLTQWGVFGFVLFVLLLKNIYKRIRSMFDDGFGLYYFLSVFSFILIGLMKNIGGREPFLMLIIIIPGLYFLQLTTSNRAYLVNERKIK